MNDQCLRTQRWGKAAGPWSEVPDEQWRDCKWQLRNLVRTPEQLSELLNLPAEETESIRALQARFRFAVSPYYFSLIDPEDPLDPIRRMIVPSSLEHAPLGVLDPLAEKKDKAAPGLTHRYPDRVLFVITSFCSSYCRFCIRKRNWKESGEASSREEIDQALAYIREHEEIEDVLISGGDPLTLPLERLEYVLQSLREIDHVQFVRIGSREPVMLPMRIGDDLLRVLDRNGPIWLNTHFNHPREITEESAAACERLVRAGVPVNNQSVLLAGVNDSVETMRALVKGLLRIRVRPYYLYHADPVVGAGHLRTSLWKGMEIMESMIGHITGLAVPRFVMDAPDGGGKIPVMPNYIVSAAPGRIVLRNFEGALFSYPEVVDDTAPPKPAQSVADLLSGASSKISPTGNKHYERRNGKNGKNGHNGHNGRSGHS
jgi:lysine 2,3-aminomutase